MWIIIIPVVIIIDIDIYLNDNNIFNYGHDDEDDGAWRYCYRWWWWCWCWWWRVMVAVEGNSVVLMWIMTTLLGMLRMKWIKTTMITLWRKWSINWPPLQHRRQTVRLCMSTILLTQAEVTIPAFDQHKTLFTSRPPPENYSLQSLHWVPSCNAYKFRFWPREIIDCNNLSNEIIESDSLRYFKSALNKTTLR